jgi:cytochrome c
LVEVHRKGKFSYYRLAGKEAFKTWQSIRGAKLYAQYCASCQGGVGEGSDACCVMMSGPNLLSAVQRINAKAFRDEVRHVGETNMCAGHLLDLSSADVEAIRNYPLELSKQAKPN